MANSGEGLGTSRPKFGYAERARAIFEGEPVPVGYQGSGCTIDPTDDEVEDWAARTRAQREAWMKGPGEEEKLRWAYRESTRRQYRLRQRERALDPRSEGRDPRRRTRLRRDAQLAAVGAMVQLFDLPFQILDSLIDTGRDWEDAAPAGRRRVSLEEDDWE